MGGREAAPWGENGHQAARGIDVRAFLELEQGLEAAGHAGVAERDTIRETERAHHEVIHRPWAEAAYGEQGALRAGGGHGAERLEIEFSLRDEPCGRDDVIGFLPGKLQREQVLRIKHGYFFRSG